MEQKTILIIGAGPAGLTAGLEALRSKKLTPIILEASEDMGGISKTINYKGNRMDIGGHRFFSKSDRIMQWWGEILPIQGPPVPGQDYYEIKYQGKVRKIPVNPKGPDPEKTDKTFLIRNRLSRIYYIRKFFQYPISLSAETLLNLGPVRVMKIFISYMRSRMSQITPEKNLEDFFINRFGKELYLTFFKDYTEKVWGVSCKEINPEWGAQRIKSLSISKAIIHALKSGLPKKKSISQKDVETSLIEYFLYPKFGPGQLWDCVAEQITGMGGQILKSRIVEEINLSEDGKSVTSVVARNLKTGETETYNADYFISTMPVKDLIAGMKGNVPANIRQQAAELNYRDFITVGVLLKRINNEANPGKILPDTWIYVQEKDVKVGRLQFFNNWSPYMVSNKDTIWLGMEYFCYEGDDLWNMPEKEMFAFAIKELAKMNLIKEEDVLDGTVVKVPKTYPGYFGDAYMHFDRIKNFVNGIENLFLVGRNGMHRYNNQDHSMLTAMTAIENINNGVTDKENIWKINTEEEYHESK